MNKESWSTLTPLSTHRRLFFEELSYFEKNVKKIWKFVNKSYEKTLLFFYIFVNKIIVFLTLNIETI